MRDFFQSKNFSRLMFGLGIVVIALLIFQAGIYVGYRRAGFSYGFGDNYFRTFGRHGGFFPVDRDLINPNGTAGRIVKVSLPTFVVEDETGVEKVVRIMPNTMIMEFRTKISPQNLALGNNVIVIGSPDAQSEILAFLIRVVPPPQNTASSTNSAI